MPPETLVGTAVLGRTGIAVSRLCFGTLAVSRLQCNLPPASAAGLFREALARGVSFFDTAELYENYDHLALLLKSVPRSSVVIATKSYSVTAGEARRSVETALRKLGTSYLDLFLLHEQQSALTLRGHRAALDELHRLKGPGLVRAVGLSTHTVAAVKAACLDPRIEVIHPLVNLAGAGIQGGTLQEMLDAILQAASSGIGVYAMKPLAGGHLGARAEEALAFVRGIPYIHSVALGMSSVDEIGFAAALFGGSRPPADLLARLRARPRRLLVEPWCDGCGACVDSCSHGALSIDSGRLDVDRSRCLLCGYCAASCPGFHLKVVSASEDHGH
jgi:aryl-alcohol dehydrogenase-like predicted oxidoreductase